MFQKKWLFGEKFKWRVRSLKRACWPIIYIVFFETVLGRENSGKVLKKFIGNFNFRGIILRWYDRLKNDDVPQKYNLFKI